MYHKSLSRSQELLICSVKDRNPGLWKCVVSHRATRLLGIYLLNDLPLLDIDSSENVQFNLGASALVSPAWKTSMQGQLKQWTLLIRCCRWYCLSMRQWHARWLCFIPFANLLTRTATQKLVEAANATVTVASEQAEFTTALCHGSKERV
ncbi:hypothetical protein K461DRAFT_156391 [Myriangium duriaei CBS 260.36]|uniref:Uncharacterized protein n=1 Tax=Myriangium duriaei CBS 260.36 TaxID=1168546 RepID=A0A9P4MLH7_9PEZI|nr:hypothetical protein K461DRAFT_156391 [Myriangium duriaei CBS 260.36]